MTGILGEILTLDDNAPGTGTVRMHDRFDTSIEDLWSAMTEPDRVARWIGRIDGDLRVGGSFSARLTSHWEGTARVDVCEPHTHLVVTMRPGEEDETVFEARLTAADGATDLLVEERGLPLETISAHGAGWQAHLEDLAAHIAGRDPVPWVDRWGELAPTYEAMSAEVRATR
ncbi:uncharacterized protein YndB with AHSA1/START domain [Conyzicola lurida]|uniref:Uncharacterized protein YndB with AHSA1/START domain n=1 Tax=Conyzicola lurida TaxID=1172621 RepID=A0A841AIA1_9MICO|nr:SRPBCC domain-containing protein [Conyzicola lurida]MBB5841722.1 uncharacterized protein YndB with AHSA1/START domain [Conyzicola lurida]